GADVDLARERKALLQVRHQVHVALGDRFIKLEHFALLARADPGDGQVELAAREPVLDQLPDLVLEREGHLGAPQRDLAETVIDRSDLAGEALPGAFELGRAVAGHAADHAGPPGGGGRTPEGRRPGLPASTSAGLRTRDSRGFAGVSPCAERVADSQPGVHVLMWR